MIWPFVETVVFIQVRYCLTGLPSIAFGFERNWSPTVPGRAWFAHLRLYAPLEAYFDKSRPLADFEKMK